MVSFNIVLVVFLDLTTLKIWLPDCGVVASNGSIADSLHAKATDGNSSTCTTTTASDGESAWISIGFQSAENCVDDQINHFCLGAGCDFSQAQTETQATRVIPFVQPGIRPNWS